MAYTDYEYSNELGKPMSLFRFSLGSEEWLFTSGDVSVFQGDDEFVPTYIRAGRLTRTGESNKSVMDVHIAANNPLSLKFLEGWLSGVMLVTVYRNHYGDNDHVVQWKGRVVSCKWEQNEATLSCDSAFTLFKRAGLRRHYQVLCPHILYSQGRGNCNVDKTSYQVDGTVASVGGNIISVNGIGGYPNGYFTAGMVLVNGTYRLITAHVDNGLTLIDRIDGVVDNDVISMWPGCDRSLTTCGNKFNNTNNFGGLPYLPMKNPFGNGAIV